MSQTKYQTEQFEATIGINRGYFHTNSISSDAAIKRFVDTWQELASAFEKEHGVYVTTRFSLGKVVYSKEKGCPDSGEDILILQGTRNPYHSADSATWRQGVLSIIEEIQKRFEQVTVQVLFQPIELVYLKDSD